MAKQGYQGHNAKMVASSLPRQHFELAHTALEPKFPLDIPHPLPPRDPNLDIPRRRRHRARHLPVRPIRDLPPPLHGLHIKQHHKHSSSSAQLSRGEMPPRAQRRSSAKRAKRSRMLIRALILFLLQLDEAIRFEGLGVGAVDRRHGVHGISGHLDDVAGFEEVSVCEEGVLCDPPGGGVVGLKAQGFLVCGEEEGTVFL